MKRKFTRDLITASDNINDLGRWVLSELQSRGIDTTKHKYEWKYTYGPMQNQFGSETFYALGDWIACFTFYGFRPTVENILENLFEGDYEWFRDDFEDFYLGQSLHQMIRSGAEVADERALGPGIATILLKNIDTGRVLWKANLDI